jgi:hypothetical protein
MHSKDNNWKKTIKTISFALEKISKPLLNKSEIFWNTAYLFPASVRTSKSGVNPGLLSSYLPVGPIINLQKHVLFYSRRWVHILKEPPTFFSINSARMYDR